MKNLYFAKNRMKFLIFNFKITKQNSFYSKFIKTNGMTCMYKEAMNMEIYFQGLSKKNGYYHFMLSAINIYFYLENAEHFSCN